MELTQVEEAGDGPDEEEEIIKRTTLEQLIQEATEQTQKKQRLEADLKRTQAPHKATERQLHCLQQEMEEARHRVQQTYARLVQKREQIAEKAGSADAEEARRSQELETAEEQLAATREKADGLKQGISNAYRSYEELEPYLEQTKQNCRAAAGNLHAVENKIRVLETSTNGSLAVFGTRCNKVKEMVRLSWTSVVYCRMSLMYTRYALHAFVVFLLSGRSLDPSEQISRTNCGSHWSLPQDCPRQGTIRRHRRIGLGPWKFGSLHCH